MGTLLLWQLSDFPQLNSQLFFAFNYALCTQEGHEINSSITAVSACQSDWNVDGTSWSLSMIFSVHLCPVCLSNPHYSLLVEQQHPDKSEIFEIPFKSGLVYKANFVGEIFGYSN